MSKNILITGSNGQLGSEIKLLCTNYPELSFYFTDKQNLDITDKSATEKFCKINKIDTIINCAAYTAVDKAQSETSLADNINHLAVRYLAEISKNLGIKFVHISTDYVFDGTAHKPYDEQSQTDPTSVYGQTKLDGEKAILDIAPSNTVIIRTSWVYSTYGNNFVKTMLRLGKEKEELGVIFDQIGTPTYASDLAETLLHILPKIDNSNVEIFNYSNEGVCSWYDFAKAIFELSNISCKVNPIQTKEYPTPAQRPSYSLLNKAKIKNRFNLDIPYWRDSLKRCLSKI